MKIFGRHINLSDDKYKYKTTVFFICLLFSALIWLLIKLTEEYTTTLVYPVTYHNIPEGKLLTGDVDSTVTIGIYDRGFTLLYLKYFTVRRALDIDLDDLRLKPKNEGYIAAAGTARWARQLLQNFDVTDNFEYIYPDTIYFNFEERISKQVPVTAEVTVDFKKQYFAYDSLRIDPSQVTVSGSRSRIDGIHFIKTRKTKFTGLDDDISQMIELEKPEKAPDVEIQPGEVKIMLDVEKFTEANIEVPIGKINKPAGLRVKLFPENVNILYLIALKDFNKVSQDMFSVAVDLSDVTKDEDKKLKVQLQSQPKFVRINRIEPPEVEFLLLK
ncbi:MAG: YbbR-like domain-containing protein [Bacteroidales bacterium]